MNIGDKEEEMRMTKGYGKDEWEEMEKVKESRWRRGRENGK